MSRPVRRNGKPNTRSTMAGGSRRLPLQTATAGNGTYSPKRGVALRPPSLRPWADGLGRTATSPAFLIRVAFVLVFIADADVVHPLKDALVLVSMDDDRAATAAAQPLIRVVHERRQPATNGPLASTSAQGEDFQ